MTIAASQPLTNQIASMLMPARGNFSVMVPGGQDLKQYCQDHTAAISQIVANLANPQSSLLKVLNDNDLARFGGFKFSWGIAAHHFFVGEIAHELTS